MRPGRYSPAVRFTNLGLLPSGEVASWDKCILMTADALVVPGLVNDGASGDVFTVAYDGGN